MIITIDPMGTQTEIADRIIEKIGDYVLALKGNQPLLLENISLYLETEVLMQKKSVLQEQGRYEKAIEKGHGRIETRECFLFSEISWLEEAKHWAGIQGFGVIMSKRQESGKEATITQHYFIYSKKDAKASDLIRIKREHWAIENNLHWTLDVTFREDDARARTPKAAENMNMLRKQALQLMKQETITKGSMSTKRLRCSWDIFYALKVLGIN